MQTIALQIIQNAHPAIMYVLMTTHAPEQPACAVLVPHVLGIKLVKMDCAVCIYIGT